MQILNTQRLPLFSTLHNFSLSLFFGSACLHISYVWLSTGDDDDGVVE